MFRNRFILAFFLFNLICMVICAETKYPVDISFLVSDIKFNKEDGLKICEVQHGFLSTFHGDQYLEGKDGIIPSIIAKFFEGFPQEKWARGLVYQPLRKAFANNQWRTSGSMKEFLKLGRTIPQDPTCISSYEGMVLADKQIVADYDYYHQNYPGILFINAATLPYWIDKYKMNQLFDLNEELKQYKADSKLYKKKYELDLSKRIQQEMPAERYVIKPRGEFLGHGVIVVASEDLDSVLEMILKPSKALISHPEKEYAYWCRNKDDSFLIEKYYKSDYLTFSKPIDGKISEEGEYHYDPTMRVAFMLKYDEGKLTYHHLGSYWRLPHKAFEEEGTLDEKTISGCSGSIFRSVAPELLNEVNKHMEKAMLLLYEKMLNRQ